MGTLRYSGIHSKCFKQQTKPEKCYKLDGICIACKKTKIKSSCFACEPNYQLSKENKCEKEVFKIPDLRSWANKARKLETNAGSGKALDKETITQSRDLQKASSKI